MRNWLHYSKYENGATLVMTVSSDGYSIESFADREPDGYFGVPNYAGWEEITAAEASAILGREVTA